MTSLVIAGEQVNTPVYPSHGEDTASYNPVIITGYLEAKAGYIGNVLGAEVEKITVNEEQNLQIIELNLPIDLDAGEIDRVSVLSRSGKPVPQDKTAKVFNDYENNNVGVKLYLPKQKNLVFKLKLIHEPDAPQ